MAKNVSKEPVTRMSGDREEKLKTLDSALTQIEKKFGKGSVMMLGDSISDSSGVFTLVPNGGEQKL